jgi:aspartyl-tRNA(Asn)/glutamyl-tRNA(Gln) amidotransferase subunit A
MISGDIAFTPATKLAKAVRSKDLSPVDITKAVLERIHRYDGLVNAFATLTADQAMDRAREAEAAIMRGDDVGPLHGVPTTIKDLALTKGVPTQFGSLTRKGNVPDVDAPLVTRLKEAGAIILGKTAVPEFGWKGVSQSPLTGITHNPWRFGYNAGASSAGAGAAAAAGFGALHQGSDGAGSIRMPAHFCGVFGLKPTYGRVPNFPLSNIDYSEHIGPLTRTVADAALMLKVMAGPHPWDHSSCESPPADYPGRLHETIKGRRAAFSPDFGHARVDHEVADLVAKAAAVFDSLLGANVEEVTPSWGPQGPDLIRSFWPAHLCHMNAWLPEWESRMDPGLVACVKTGKDFPLVRYQAMRERKYAYNVAIHSFFENWDFLLSPAVSVAAFPADRLQPEHWPQHDWDWISWAEFLYPFDLSGNPAAVIPCGFTKAGLPVGLQIVGKRFDDLGVLQASAAFEAACPWADQRPLLEAPLEAEGSHS